MELGFCREESEIGDRLSRASANTAGVSGVDLAHQNCLALSCYGWDVGLQRRGCLQPRQTLKWLTAGACVLQCANLCRAQRLRWNEGGYWR